MGEDIRRWAWIVGVDHPDREWLSHPCDVWVENPHFTGERGPHPEDTWDEGEAFPG